MFNQLEFTLNFSTSDFFRDQICFFRRLALNFLEVDTLKLLPYSAEADKGACGTPTGFEGSGIIILPVSLQI